MTGKKVKPAFIVNDSARKTTYTKRKKGLLKKVDELSTLCGIEACAIVYSPYDPQPEIWPSPGGVQCVLSKFEMMPELEKTKKMVNQETFLKQMILKAKEQVKKQRKENKEQEMTIFMFQCLVAGKIVDDNISIADLNQLSWLIEKNLKDIGRRMETLDKNAQGMAPGQAHVATSILEPAPATAPTPVIAQNEEMTLVDQTHGLGMSGDASQRQWFLDLMINGNGDEAIPFGDVNLPMGDLPNLLP